MARHPLVEVVHGAGVVGEPLGPGRRVLGELVELHHRRHQRGAAGDHLVRRGPRSEAGAVLDAVDPGADEAGEHPAPKQCAVTLAPSAWAAAMAGGERLGREADGIRSPSLAVDPVPHQLDPAVAAAGLLRGVRRQLVGLDLVGVVADVALGARRCGGRSGSAAAGRRGRGPSGCRRRCRRRGSAAHRRRGRRSPAARPPPPSLTAPSSSSPRWQWASTRPGTIQPSATVSAPGHLLVGDPAVDDVQVAGSPSGRTGPEKRSAVTG